MKDTAKKAIYAAVGAPVVTIRTVGSHVEGVRDSIGERATKLADWIGADVSRWAEQGEKIVHGLTDRGENIASRVDMDQIQKIREQLEEMLEAWRDSFRPQKQAVKVEEKAAEPVAEVGAKAAPKPANGKAAQAKAPTKKPAAKKPAARQETAEAPTETEKK